MVMAPLAGAILLNTLSTAIFCPPAVAKISKFDKTAWPLIETFSIRWPAPPSKSSANFKVT